MRMTEDRREDRKVVPSSVKVSVNQPRLLPWGPYWDVMAASDVHVILDDAQFEKGSYVNRVKIRSKTNANGWQWLTCPVKTAGKFGDLPVNRLEFARDDTPMKIWETLRHEYRREPEWSWFEEEMRSVFVRESGSVFDMLFDGLYGLHAMLGMMTQLVQSSWFESELKRSERLIELVQLVGGTEYVTGPTARQYLDFELFENAGVTVTVIGETPKASLGLAEADDLSIVDALVTLGPDAVLNRWCKEV